MKRPMRLVAAILGSMSVAGLAAVWFADIAQAQASHSHLTHGSLFDEEVMAYIVHGITQGASVFLAGLVTFVTLIWFPSSRAEDNGHQKKAVGLFRRWIWMLVGLLIIAGMVELPLYAVRASGEALSPGLLREALLDTRVGQLWMERLVFGVLTATMATYAAAGPRRFTYRWGAAVVASVLLLMTLTQQSHAAAEESFLPFLADWLHMTAASLWMGGLLGFPILLVGLLRTMPTELRAELLKRSVRRFSKVAMIAVMIVLATGLYAALLHVPSVSALIGTPYGHALLIKLGLLGFLLALGAQNLRLEGRGPFSRFVGAELVLAIGIFIATGFLTSLPPADADQPGVGENGAVGNIVVRVSGTQGISYSGNYGKVVEGQQGKAFEGWRMVYDTLGAEPVEYKVGDEEGAFAFFQKNQAGGTLRVEILKDGKPVASRETSEEFGAVDVVWPPQAETTAGNP
ncbi:MAG TPA: CopD family protein [Rubrobacteraceae bacterium]|nr:CopD family protein [Rubrobacteraceae bacterium]